MLRVRSILLTCLIASVSMAAGSTKLESPISVDYQEKHLAINHPRLVFTPEALVKLTGKIHRVPVLENRYAVIKLNAERIHDEPLLMRTVTGKRLLSISRGMLYRVNMLGLVYLVGKDPQALRRFNEELLEVSELSYWNPSRFLDVEEMSLAVELACDWTHGDLPKATDEKVRTALFRIPALLVGRESRFASSSRLELRKNSALHEADSPWWTILKS